MSVNRVSEKSISEKMNSDEVLKYRKILEGKKAYLKAKRMFDFLLSLMLIVLLFPIYIVVAVMVKLDSDGTVFYRQKRITSYGKEFYIYKFRTMVMDADKKGSLVTVGNDERVTRMGKFLRKFRLDETPQLINVLKGEMSFVGTRPEVLKYVEMYEDEMFATLLLPAGITSEASIYYKDEERLLKDAEDVDKVYAEEILPEKMKYNLNYLENISFAYDIKIILKTAMAVLS